LRPSVSNVTVADNVEQCHPVLEAPPVSLQKKADLREHETAILVKSSLALGPKAKNFMEVILVFAEQIYGF